MLRVFFIGVVVTSFPGESGLVGYTANKETVDYVINENSIDPIITGHSISDEHKRSWKIQNKKYLECGLCGEEPQPFPGD